MSKQQWVLTITFAASWYNVGTIWMTHVAWRLWTHVAPADFDTYHRAWWAMIKPIIFPVAAVAFAGSIGLVWWRPEGVNGTAVWLNLVLQVATYALTAVFWGRWQARIHYARLPDGLLDALYSRAINTHWIRAAIITANGLIVLCMLIAHLSSQASPFMR